ncbi:hypothetical protein C8R48DRAFT_678013 [Suillus tomentosus]|nr:hypothetical protein C8R48DRAFT_678013 [Suillus tomentosus]
MRLNKNGRSVNLNDRMVMNQFWIVLNTGELGEQICLYLDFKNLHNLSKMCMSSRAFVAGVHRRQYLKILRRYSPEQVLELCDCIHEGNGVMTGSSALSLFLRLDSWTPHDLNIVTPRGNTSRLQKFLLQNGYINTSTNAKQSNMISPAMASVVLSHQVFVHHLDSSLEISVTESIDDSILTVILTNISTTEMVFATPHGLFCAHPRLTFRHIALHAFPRKLGTKYVWKAKRYKKMDLVPHRNTKQWQEECGRDCPVNWHNIDNPKDLLVIDWNRTSPDIAMTDESPHRHIIGQHLYWRLGHRCQNNYCLSKKYEIPPVTICASHWEEIVHTKEILAGHPELPGTAFGTGTSDDRSRRNDISGRSVYMPMGQRTWQRPSCYNTSKTQSDDDSESSTQQSHLLLEKAPSGNILVLKRGKTDANEVQDVNRADIAQITDVICHGKESVNVVIIRMSNADADSSYHYDLGDTGGREVIRKELAGPWTPMEEIANRTNVHHEGWTGDMTPNLRQRDFYDRVHTIMDTTVCDMIAMCGGEGGMIFERQTRGINIYNIHAQDECNAQEHWVQEERRVILATEEVYECPLRLAETCDRIAKDCNIDIVVTETLALAQYLVDKLNMERKKN